MSVQRAWPFARWGRCLASSPALAVAIATTSFASALAAQPTPAAPSVAPAEPFGATAAGHPSSTAPAAVTPPRSEFGEVDSVDDVPLDEGAPFRSACIDAAFFASHTTDFVGCYGVASADGWRKLAAASRAYESRYCGPPSGSQAAVATARALEVFHAAVSEAENAARSPDAFEALVQFEAIAKNQTRRNACRALRQSERTQLVKAEGARAASLRSATLGAEVSTQPSVDHASDTLRKSQGTASATTTTTSLIENPGSPDKLAFSVLSALGADSKTTGTQTVLNLSLSSLLWPSETERLAQPAWGRNLFVRGAFPLSATDKVPQTGAGAASAGSSVQVSRFSLLLGGSLLDETDTRLPSARECYELAAAYVPFPQTSDEAASRTEERKQLYDVCAHLAAQKTRLGWRGGLGFYTPNDVDTPKTRPELAVGAIVWGPTSWLYLNFLYQGIIEPNRIDNMGVGFSLAGNADATRSGVNALARVGLDFIFMLNYQHADRTTDWEMRIAPTVRGKLFGNSIGTLAAGPRFLGGHVDSPGVLATLALSYDADTLVDSLLTPAPPSTK